MRIFVAGASGVIGRRLVRMLVAEGHEVTGMTRSPQRAEAIAAQGAEPAVCDVFARERLTEAISAAHPEAVIHELTDLPQAMKPRRLERDLAGNDRVRTEGTRNLVAAAQAAGARTLIAQSVAFAYAPEGDWVKDEEARLALDAPWPWRRSVEAVRDLEQAVVGAQGMRGIVLRYGYFYGPGTGYAADGALGQMVLKRRFPVIGKGQGYASLIHIDDAARATIAALDHGDSGVYNVVDDEPAPMSEWLPVFAQALRAKPPRRVPLWVGRLFGGPYVVQLATEARGASNAKAKRELGWQPRYPSWRTGFFEGDTGPAQQPPESASPRPKAA